MARAAGVRIFRIFLSSTFTDFQAERNSLHEKVFPRLKQLCHSYGTEFQVVDLRWGITDAMANNQKTLETCLREIKRCQQLTPKPNFLALVGNRYGWTPPPPRIPNNEFEAILAICSPEEQSFLKDWYKEDLNALPHLEEEQQAAGGSVYELLPRIGKYLDWDIWQPIETRLREILLKAAKKLSLPEEQFLKYYASATHQEIVKGALEKEESTRHVQCFVRELEKISPQEAEETYYELAPEKIHLLTKLKKMLRSRLPPENIHTFRPDFSEEHNKEEYLEAFCSAIYSRLREQIMDELAKLEEEDEVTTECTQHEQFARERAAVFVGRKKIIEQLVDYLTPPSQQQVLFVSGSTGTGKSALLAYLITKVLVEKMKQQQQHNKQKTHLLYRFLGTTAKSDDSPNFLRSMLLQLEQLTGKRFSDGTYATKQSEIAGLFKKSLEELPNDKSFLFIIDALDQLIPRDKGRSLNWLPATLPANVKIICSYSTDAQDIGSIVDQRTNTATLALQHFTVEEGEENLLLLLEKAKRRLQPNQKAYLLEQFKKVGTPLYLKLAFEGSLQWASYTKEYSLASTTKGLIKQLFNRLERIHGKPTIQKVLSYLVSARFGLSETEILDLLSSDKGYFQDYYLQQIYHPLPEPRVPSIVWSLVYADLEQYLTVQGVANYPLVTFFHRGFKEVIEEVYLPNQSEKVTCHRILADYFAGQEIWLQSEEKREPNIRKLSEEIFQLFQNKKVQPIHALLTDLDYLEAKNTAGLYFDLAKEFNQLVAIISSSEVQQPKNAGAYTPDQRKILQAFHRFVLNQGHILNKYPALLRQQALNQPDSSPIYQIAHNQLLTNNKPKKWIQWRNKPQTKDPCLRTFEGHTHEVRACAFSPDGTKILTASRDGTLKLWDISTGELLQKLEGHTQGVTACAFSPDGTKVLSGSGDFNAGKGRLKLWDIATGEELKTLEGHSTVKACAFSPDGTKIIALASTDIELWDVASGEQLQTLKGLWYVNDCAFSPNGTYILSASSYSGNHKIWDANTGELLQTLEGYDAAEACAFSPDGTKILFGMVDETLKLLDTSTFEVLQTFKGHTHVVLDCAFSPDGSRILSASLDKSVKVWDTATGELLQTLQGHSERVYACAFSPDGTKILSSSKDGKTKLWDAAARKEERTLEGHSGWVLACAFSPDGTQVLSSSHQIKLWDWQTGKQKLTIDSANPACVFSRDGSKILSPSVDNTLKIWDAKTGEELLTLEGHHTKVRACAFSPDGSRVISASEDFTVKIWDTATGEELQTLKHNNWVLDCTFSPDGSRVLSASREGTLKIWDTATGKELETLEGHTSSVSVCVFSPDGTKILSGSDDNSLKIWDATTGKELRTLKGHTEFVDDCAFSPDGSQILSVSADYTAKLWDAATGKQLQTLERHDGWEFVCIFSPDGTKILSASSDYLLKFWDISTWKEIGIFVGHAPFYAAAWGSKNTIIAGDGNGSVYILKIHGLKSNPPIITLKYLYKIREGRWQKTPSSRCPVCGYNLKITEEVLKKLKMQDIKELLGKILECPQCTTSLKMNPFIVDNRRKD
ncbi:MAG: DUF4062 domain-containing protein [Candidatus Heimdallarchaeota archaeon]|nr:DUF4062 domain-containing protein [Candidatus Heimdallarchaeota archaeon]